MPTTPKRPATTRAGRPRSVQSQQAILQATLALLTSLGFEALSFEAVAAKAGVGKKTIYRWWASKEALVVDAVRTLQQTQNPVVDTGSLRSDLKALARNVLRLIAQPEARALTLHLAGAMARHPEVYAVFHERVIAPRFAQVAEMLRRARERGEIRRDVDPDEVLGFLAGPFWYQIVFSPGEASLSPARIERMLDVIFRGIEPRGASESDDATKRARPPATRRTRRERAKR